METRFCPLPWAIVPQPDSEDDHREPVYFSGKNGALPWQRDHDAGWYRAALPVLSLPPKWNDSGGHLRLCQYLPLSEVGDREVSWDVVVADAVEDRDYEMTCLLWDDWQFEVLSGRARFREGHLLHVRTYASLAAALLAISHDLEAELYIMHPRMDAVSAARFWQSWQVHSYLRKMAFAASRQGYLCAHRRLTRML